MKKKLIIVTDGDMRAKDAVEVACKNLNLRCISLSAGNPTPLDEEQALHLIMAVQGEHVVFMADDRGQAFIGEGEKLIKYLAEHEDIELMGVLAVASNSASGEGVYVDFSIDCQGNIVETNSVDKEGQITSEHNYLRGDTVSVLKDIEVPVIAGVGDIGKMNGKDDPTKGAPLTTSALKMIIERSEHNGQ
ncbi:stage V sporulation protein AE [Desulfitispora alkaliphila]|uniref:stage V sporulation protein AE n=1 Tax=Desulfitispora alkaliphila TaxID=622674 RepID=UPI003D20CC38